MEKYWALRTEAVLTKFLFVTRDKYPPYRPDTAFLFAEELAGRGHQIDWLLQAEHVASTAKKVQWGGGTAWIAKAGAGESSIGKIKGILFDACNDLRMFPLARKRHYDFIQVKDKFFSAVTGLVAAKLYGLKFVYWLSFPFPEDMLYRMREGCSRYPYLDYVRGHLFKLLLYRIIVPNASHVFVQSDQMKNDIAAMGIPKHKLTPVPMGVSMRRIPSPSDYKHDVSCEQEKTVVYLGALDRIRRIDFLIRVFHQVHCRVPGAKLYLVGSSFDPADTASLERLAAGMGLRDAVVFTGFLPMEEAWRYVARAAVAVSPFYPTPVLQSTSPTKLIEYMAMAKPVVVNDHPEQRQVIAGSGGGICVPYDEAAFADAVVELLTKPSEAKAMGLRGRRYVAECRSYAVLADRVEQCYRQLCTNKSHSR
jgi:glycosyltransferase involved in cell wall biosynthesis